MYINKLLYYPAKVITGIGNFFWGTLTLVLLAGVLIPQMRNGFDEIVSATGAFATIWAGHFFLGELLQKAKFYNTFLENDKDGSIQCRVISKAIGRPEPKIIKDIKLLSKLNLLAHCTLNDDNHNTITLSNPKFKYTHHAPATLEKICPHCGGKNTVRAGFVASCIYCDGSLEK